jgi:hypothetical protein
MGKFPLTERRTAGPETDRLVHQLAFGGEDGEQVPAYSTDADWARQVVERMDVLGWDLRMSESHGDGPERPVWRARFEKRTVLGGLGALNEAEGSESRPLAICMAALLALQLAGR